jgi:nitrile hydratase beta subunit
MNGVHDMGGMHGMGPIEAEKSEPVFHQPWEGRIYSLTRAMGAWNRWNLDTRRFEDEQLAPADYLRMSYYEKWFVTLVELVVKTDFVSRSEVDTGRPDPGFTKMTPPLTADRVRAVALNRNIAPSHDPNISPRFKAGQHVRAKNINPTGHTRLPRYARGKAGRIHLDHGVYNFPDSNAQGLGIKRQHVYSVRFAARELWGNQASSHDSVYLDMWDDYLEHA